MITVRVFMASMFGIPSLSLGVLHIASCLRKPKLVNDMHYLIIKGHFNVIRDFHIYIIFITQAGISTYLSRHVIKKDNLSMQ